ncbi:MAG: biopolymer transporter ExbD [Xanthomonadaceae bacterium]|nr:biopolymer transporter ExbD [Xanthomonadaceae bacterium]
MRRSHVTQEEEAEINITPMLDVVFIMLIFFIVTATFVRETGIDVTRPDAQTAQQQQRPPILIAISKDGEIWFDRRRIDIRAVRANVERALAENPEGGVVILADRESITGLLVEVMDEARLAGAPSVSIASEQQE